MSKAARRATVLCVDDDPRVLRALGRDLGGRGYEVMTAATAADAEKCCAAGGVDAALVDLRLGAEDGIRLLAELKRVSPQTLRLLLTGFGDYSESVRAINEGQVFAFLEKPWDAATLDDIIRAGLDAERAQTDRAELRADDTGVERVRPELGSLLSGLRLLETPLKAGHHERLETMLRGFCEQLQLRAESIERVALAARVHDLAEVAVPELARGTPVEALSPDGRQAWQAHPERMAEMLDAVPALAPVAEIVRTHHERHDGSGFPRGLAGDAIPVPVRVFALADTYDELVHGGLSPQPLSEPEARERLHQGSGRQFDARVVNVFLRWLAQRRTADEPAMDDSEGVEVRALQPGMVLAEDLLSPEGLLLVPAGHRLNEALIHRIMSLGEEGLWRKRVRLEERPAGGRDGAAGVSGR